MFKRTVTRIGESISSSFLAEILKLLLLPLIVGIGVTVWEVIREGWTPLGVTIGIWALGGTLFVVERATSYYKRLEETPVAWKDRRLAQTLQEWAMDYGYEVGRLSTTDTQQKFWLTAQKEYRINVVGATTHIETYINWVTGQLFERQFKELSTQDFQALHKKLTVELGRHGIGFRVPPDLSAVRLFGQLPRDNSLSQYVFNEHLFFISRARWLAAQIIDEAIGEPGIEEVSENEDPTQQRG